MAANTDRLSILAKLRARVGDDSEQSRVTETLVFCIEDGAPLPADGRLWHRGYRHDDHEHDRAFIFDDVARWEFRADGELRHFTGGTILWRRGGLEPEYCLVRRTTFPVGWYTLAAGHVDRGEDARRAALREAYEETGLGIVAVEPFVIGEEIHDSCRRGADYHVWDVYVCECIGEARLSREGDIIGWYTRREIIEDLPLTAPTAYFFGRYFDASARRVWQASGS